MRYSRLKLFAKDAEKLRNKTVAVVGLGSLGCLSVELLARNGINLILVDRDIIDLANLNSQILYNEQDINKLKAIAAKEKLKKVNSEIKITALPVDLTFENIDKIKSDLILDCTDNLETKFLLNEFSVKNNIPLIHASVIKDKGIIFNITNKPCLRCFLKETDNIETCDTVGVLNTAASLVSSIQANEAIKILLNKNYEENLLRINLANNEIEKIKVKENKKCPVCNNKFEYLNGKQRQIIKFCGSNNYQFKGTFNLNELKKKLMAKDLKYCLQCNNLTIFKDRVLIKAKNELEAKKLFAKYIA